MNDVCVFVCWSTQQPFYEVFNLMQSNRLITLRSNHMFCDLNLSGSELGWVVILASWPHRELRLPAASRDTHWTRDCIYNILYIINITEPHKQNGSFYSQSLIYSAKHLLSPEARYSVLSQLEKDSTEHAPWAQNCRSVFVSVNTQWAPFIGLNEEPSQFSIIHPWIWQKVKWVIEEGFLHTKSMERRS